jgi:hypothetical protein
MPPIPEGLTPAVYMVSLLPEDHVNYRAYALTVAYHGGRWTVTHGTGVYLDTAGRWTEAREDQAGGDAWRAAHLFGLDEALRLAKDATVAVNGITAAAVIRRTA